MCNRGRSGENYAPSPIAHVSCSISRYYSPEKCEKIEPVLQARSNGLWFRTFH